MDADPSICGITNIVATLFGNPELDINCTRRHALVLCALGGLALWGGHCDHAAAGRPVSGANTGGRPGGLNSANSQSSMPRECGSAHTGAHSRAGMSRARHCALGGARKSRAAAAPLGRGPADAQQHSGQQRAHGQLQQTAFLLLISILF